MAKYATRVVDTGSNFATGVVDTGDKFPTGVVDIYPWCTLTFVYLRKILKKLETVLMGYFGAGGKLIHEKPEAKIS